MKNPFLLLLSLLALLYTPTFSQKRFSVGLTAAPAFSHSYTNFTFTAPDQTGQLVSTDVSQRSSNWFATVGTSVDWAFTSRYSLTTGIWFSQSRMTQSYPFGPANVSARVISSGWAVPLLVNYRFSDRRLSPIVSAGALGSFGGSTRLKPEAGSGLQEVRINFGNELTVRPMLGAGVSYRINPRWSLLAQPLLIWRFRPKDDQFIRYNRAVSYQLQGQVRLLYALL